MFKKLSLELGGKNAAIVFPDCNFDSCIATIIRSSFSNQGEICLCSSRIFIHVDLFDKFVNSLVHFTEKLIVGDPTHPDTDIGAIVSSQHLSKISGFVDLARKLGGTILTGGKQLKINVDGSSNGFFYAPTIISGLNNSSPLNQQEIFGPVVTVMPFTSIDEVVGYANDTVYGLSASVWTENERIARQVANRLDVGTCWINCWMVRDLNMPFGGVKDSGVGREGGRYSREFFTEEKVICIAN